MNSLAAVASVTPPSPRPRPRVVLHAAAPGAEMFCAPSREAVRLLRWAPAVFSPREGLGSLPARALRSLLIAPFTQLTFVSFDLQMFLFDVLHTSTAARVGHAVGMAGVTLFAMALAAHALGPWGGALVAAVLLAWYGAVARAAGLRGWWAAMVPVVGALWAGAAWVSGAWSGSGLLAGLLASGWVVAGSHIPEPLYPARAGDPHRWMTLREFVLGPPSARLGWRAASLRAARVAADPLIGLCNELWASPRLLPYNVLRLMLAAGYAPELKRVLDDRAARALASGNPALDYVGIGGGTFLAVEDP